MLNLYEEITIPAFNFSVGTPCFAQISNVEPSIDRHAAPDLQRIQSIQPLSDDAGKEQWERWGIYAQIGSTALTLIGFLGVFIQLRLAREANKAGVVIDLFNEFRSSRWQAARRILRRKGGYINFNKVANYSHLLNHFGFLLEHKYVDERSVYETMGLSVMSAWKVLSPQIIQRRKESDDPLEHYPYQYHFEYLNYRMRKYFPKGKKRIGKLMKKMKALPPLEDPVPPNILGNF